MKIEKDLITKMVIAAVLGILIIVCVIIAVNMLRGDDDATAQVVPAAILENEEDEKPLEEEEVLKVAEYERMLALVKDMDETGMHVYNIEDDLAVSLNITGSVRFEDEYGTAVVMDKIEPGYIVNVKYDKDTYIPELVKISPQIQLLKNLSSLTIDEVLKTIQIGSDIYEYNEEMIATNGEETLVLSELSAADDVIVRVYQGKIWSILVENGHGYVVLENYDAYIDGRLEIGNRTSYDIIEDMRVAVTAGIHQVVITKENMDPYTASILIEEDKEYIIDLIDLQPQFAEVDFELIQSGSILYINGELTELTDEPVKLDFGQYNIKVENDGFMDWEGILIVDQPYLKQTIDMEDEPLQIHMKGPAGAEFYIDAARVGILVDGVEFIEPILPGGHVLTLRKDGYQSWSQTVFIEDLGEDYYYTVPELTEIPKEPEVIPETEPETDPVESEGDGVDTPSDDTYQGD